MCSRSTNEGAHSTAQEASGGHEGEMEGGAKGGRSFAPVQTATYLSPQYWDARFAQEDRYEWCKDYGEFKHLVMPHLRHSDAILELGCGNSGMAAALADDGFANVTATDLSATVVARMQQKVAASGRNVKYQVADMLSLPFQTGSFDAILEKGAVEVFFTDSTSAWNPPPHVCKRVSAVLDEVHRVLRPDGVFISISFGQPHFRTPFMAAPRYSWSVEVERFGEGFDYFVYIMRKGCRQVGEQVANETPPVLGPVVRQRGANEEGCMHEHLDSEEYLMRISPDL